MNEDLEAIVRLKRGEAAAFTELVDKYRKCVYALVYRVVRNHASADDLVQDAFVALWEHRDTLKEEYPLYPWLRRVAMNKTINAIGRAKHGLDASDNLERVAEKSWRGSAESQAEHGELRVAVNGFIRSLSADRRATLLLRMKEGLSYQEIADHLGCSVGTVMSRLHRVRMEMKGKLGDLVS